LLRGASNHACSDFPAVSTMQCNRYRSRRLKYVKEVPDGKAWRRFNTKWYPSPP
jgi:hypothetical protein